MRAHGAICLLLLAATAAVYVQVRDHAFIDYDDPAYIVDNPLLRSGLTPAGVWRSFAEPHETNWIPLTWLSLQLDYALYGLEPAGYHLTNVALHALSSVLLFLALARATGATGRSAFVAAVFALHPLHVESVAWAAERKDSLSGLFWMLSLLAYVRYAERPGPARYAAVAAGVALALLAKPMAVTLPLVLLLLDYWPLGRLGTAERLLDRARTTRAVIEKLPLLALSAAVAAVTFSVQRATGAMSHDGMLRPALRLRNGLESYVIYGWKSLWPSDLAPFYPHPLAGSSPLLAVACAALLAAVTALALRAARARPYLVVGWLWYLGTLAPVIGIVQVGMQARADRYTYLPLVGLSIALAWSAVDGLGRGRAARRALAAAAVAVPLALGAAAWVQVGYWRDTATLFGHAVRVTEDNFLAHQVLAGALLDQGRLEEAQAHFARAAELKPSWSAAQAGLASVLFERGQIDAAIDAYERLLERDPRFGRAHANLGKALIVAGRPDEAIAHLERALELKRDTGIAHIHGLLAEALAQKGEDAAAVRHLEQALALQPEFHEARANLGLARLRAGRHAEARRELRLALAGDPDSLEVHLGLARVASRLGRPGEAIEHYRHALRLEPGLRSAANNLAWLLATAPDAALRDPDEAVRLAERARAATPDDPGVLDTLAAAYAAQGRFEAAVRTGERALAAARGDSELAAAIRGRLALYRREESYSTPRP